MIVTGGQLGAGSSFMHMFVKTNANFPSNKLKDLTIFMTHCNFSRSSASCIFNCEGVGAGWVDGVALCNKALTFVT